MRNACPIAVLVLLAHAEAFAQPVSATSNASGNSLSVPLAPAVNDPMLAPPPAPKRILTSWKEGLTYLRSRSTDLKIALDQVLQAEAQTRIALAQYLPWINANNAGGVNYTRQLITRSVGGGLGTSSAGGLTQTSQVPIPNTFSGAIQLQQTLLNVQAFDQISINELAEDASRLSVEAEKRTLTLSLANQIVAVVTAERAAEINRVGLRVALEQLEITKRKQSLGAANGLDVVRANQNSANARATLVTGDETLREAREALGLALGIPEETGVATDVHIEGLAESALASCRSVPDIDSRSDIAAAHVQLDVAKRNLRSVWFSFLPTISVGSNLSAASPVASGYPNPVWNIQASLEVPIWDGGTRYGNLRNARAAEDIASQQLEALRRQAIIQVEQAARQLKVAQDSDKVATEQRNLAAQNDTMTETAYMAGQGTSLELITASEAHRQAELNLALQDFNVVKARVLALLALASCPW